jgi:hypothetical protein
VVNIKADTTDYDAPSSVPEYVAAPTLSTTNAFAITVESEGYASSPPLASTLSRNATFGITVESIGFDSTTN